MRPNYFKTRSYSCALSLLQSDCGREFNVGTTWYTGTQRRGQQQRHCYSYCSTRGRLSILYGGAARYCATEGPLLYG